MNQSISTRRKGSTHARTHAPESTYHSGMYVLSDFRIEGWFRTRLLVLLWIIQSTVFSKYRFFSPVTQLTLPGVVFFCFYFVVYFFPLWSTFFWASCVRFCNTSFPGVLPWTDYVRHNQNCTCQNNYSARGLLFFFFVCRVSCVLSVPCLADLSSPHGFATLFCCRLAHTKIYVYVCIYVCVCACDVHAICGVSMC